MDLRESAARITPPTLLIAGAHDVATSPERAREIARAMPRTPDVESPTELHELLSALPLFPYMHVTVTALCRHPSSIHDDDR
jgi:pimeloyl-ACP methyl ester carboxylesterase